MPDTLDSLDGGPGAQPPAGFGTASQPSSLQVLTTCRAKGWRLATAESCTGGLIAAALTDHPGASDVLERGIVSYSNEAKISLLGVPPALIAAHGAVSREVAAAMAEGLLERAPVTITVSVTGIAGPDGGSLEKPVGLVWFGCAVRGRASCTQSRVFQGDRAAVRAGAVEVAFAMVLSASAG